MGILLERYCDRSLASLGDFTSFRLEDGLPLNV